MDLAGPPAGTPTRRETGLVAAAAVVFLHLLFFREGAFVHGRDPLASGFALDEPARVAAGQVMYRDFFECQGPGLVYLHAAVIAAFGQRITPLGYLFVLIGAVLACAAFRLASRLTTSRLRLLAPLAFVALVYARNETGDHKWPAVLCGLLAAAAFARADTARGAIAGGSLLGAAALFTPDLGAGMAIALLAGALCSRDRRRIVLPALGGALATTCLVLAYFAARAGAATVAYDLVVFPLTRYHEVNRYYVNVLPFGVPGTARLAIGLGGAAAAVLALGARPPFRGLDPGQRRLLQAMACAGLGLAAGAAHRGLDVTGLAWQAILLVPFVALLDRARADRRMAVRAAAVSVAALVGLGAAWAAVEQVANVQAGREWTRQSHRAGDVWLPRPWPALSWLEAQAGPGEPVFFMPALGGYEFFSRTRGATSFPALHDLNTPEQIQTALAEIEHRRPRVGVLDPGPAGPITRPDGFFPPVQERLLRRYEAERLPSGVWLLRLRPAGP